MATSSRLRSWPSCSPQVPSPPRCSSRGARNCPLQRYEGGRDTSVEPAVGSAPGVALRRGPLLRLLEPDPDLYRCGLDGPGCPVGPRAGHLNGHRVAEVLAEEVEPGPAGARHWLGVHEPLVAELRLRGPLARVGRQVPADPRQAVDDRRARHLPQIVVEGDVAGTVRIGLLS